jgi:hypothetical protein
MASQETNFEPTQSPGLILREWALRTLREEGAVQNDDLRSALVKRLPSYRFVPSAPLFYAARSQVETLSDAVAKRVESTVIAEVDASMGTEVEDFCSGFFSINCQLRREKWHELRRRTAASPHLSKRLDALHAGLDVDFETVHPGRDELKQIVDVMRELFVLTPADRALRRQAFLTTCERGRAKWRAASWRLARRFPKVADLDPYLLKQLRSLRADWLQLREFKVKEPAQTQTRNQMSPRQTALWLVVGMGVVAGTFSSQLFELKPRPKLLEPRDFRRFEGPIARPRDLKPPVFPGQRPYTPTPPQNGFPAGRPLPAHPSRGR